MRAMNVASCEAPFGRGRIRRAETDSALTKDHAPRWTATSGRRQTRAADPNAPEGRVPPSFTGAAIAFPVVAFVFAFVFLFYPAVAARPGLLFTFAIAAVLYLGLPIEALLGFPLDPASSYLSELAARDQPYAMAFRLTDGLGAVLVLAGTVLLSTRLALRRLAAYSTAALALFAVATVVDVIFPMACATSADPECARGDAEGTLGLSHQIHIVTSVLALAAGNVSAVLLSVFAARNRRRGHPGLIITLLVLVAILLSSSVAISLAALDGTDAIDSQL